MPRRPRPPRSVKGRPKHVQARPSTSKQSCPYCRSLALQDRPEALHALSSTPVRSRPSRSFPPSFVMRSISGQVSTSDADITVPLPKLHLNALPIGGTNAALLTPPPESPVDASLVTRRKLGDSE